MPKGKIGISIRCEYCCKQSAKRRLKCPRCGLKLCPKCYSEHIWLVKTGSHWEVKNVEYYKPAAIAARQGVQARKE